jgi:hypothetical protein
VEGRAAQRRRQVAQARQRLHPLVEDDLHRLHQLALPPCGGRGRPRRAGRATQCRRAFVRQLGHHVLNLQAAYARVQQAQELVLEVSRAGRAEAVAHAERPLRVSLLPRRVVRQQLHGPRAVDGEDGAVVAARHRVRIAVGIAGVEEDHVVHVRDQRLVLVPAAEHALADKDDAVGRRGLLGAERLHVRAAAEVLHGHAERFQEQAAAVAHGTRIRDTSGPVPAHPREIRAILEVLPRSLKSR